MSMQFKHPQTRRYTYMCGDILNTYLAVVIACLPCLFGRVNIPDRRQRENTLVDLSFLGGNGLSSHFLTFTSSRFTSVSPSFVHIYNTATGREEARPLLLASNLYIQYIYIYISKRQRWQLD